MKEYLLTALAFAVMLTASACGKSNSYSSDDIDELIDKKIEEKFEEMNSMTSDMKNTEKIAFGEAKKITVPNFIGCYYSESLKAQLEASGYYSVEVIFEDSREEDKDKVLSQDPLPGEIRKVVPYDPDRMCKLTLKVGLGTDELMG